jgi:molecular chaperone GrpE
LVGVLERSGLTRIEPSGEPFDPNAHDAVLHEAADDPDAAPTVVEVLRPGYAWKGRVIRPAMVKVKG